MKFNKKDEKFINQMVQRESIESLHRYGRLYTQLIEEQSTQSRIKDLQLIDEAIARKTKDETSEDIIKRWGKL